MDLLNSKKFKQLKKQIQSLKTDKGSKSELILPGNGRNIKNQTLRTDKPISSANNNSFRKNIKSSKLNTSRNITSALPDRRNEFHLLSKSKSNFSKVTQPLNTYMPPLLEMPSERSTVVPSPPSTLNISKASLMKKKIQEPDVMRHTFLKPCSVPVPRLNVSKMSHINRNISMQRNYMPFQSQYSSNPGFLPMQNTMFNMFGSQTALHRSYQPSIIDKSVLYAPAYSLEEKQLIASISNERLDSLLKKLEMFCECTFIDDLEKVSFLDNLYNYYAEQYRHHMALMQQNTDDDKQNKFEQIESWMNATQTAQPEQVAYPLNPGLQPMDAPMDNFQECEESFTNEEQLPSNTSQNSDNIVVPQKTGQFFLKNWTVLKDEGGLKVAGTLANIVTRQTIENNHVSENIIELTKNNTVRTNTCTYMLSMNFVDPTNSIPLHIKKFFKTGKFPSKWQSIAKIWHAQEFTPTRKKNMPGNDLTTPVQSRKKTLERTIITRSVAKKQKVKRLGLFAKDYV